MDDVTLAPGHTHATWASAMPADVAEFCPVDSLTDWLAVGMYELDEATSRRRGRVRAGVCRSRGRIWRVRWLLAKALRAAGREALITP